MRANQRTMVVLCGALAACGPKDEASATLPESTSEVFGTLTETRPPSPTSAAEPTTGTGGGAGTSTSTAADTGATAADPSTGGSTTGDGPKFDLPDVMCDPDAICCKAEGFIPPHTLLEAFLATYPPASMPKTVADVQAFEPVADGHMMTWSQENVGNELVDAGNGGVIEANILAGRALARAAAEMEVPADAAVLEVREDPVIIEDLGTPSPCIGVGWAWGSLLFEAADQSIGELVYLYIGFCSDGDVEAFYYSEQAVEVCPPPG